MYRNYEKYMQTVLGYNRPNTSNISNTYEETNNYYNNNVQINQNMQEINKFYPEIYGIVYPVVQKVCSRRNLSNVTEEMISQMVDEVYRVIEPEEMKEEAPLKNGDVRNPRARETRQPVSRNNRLLRDLIRILVLREIFGRPRLFSRKTSDFREDHGGFPGGGPGGFPGGGPGGMPGGGPRR